MNFFKRIWQAIVEVFKPQPIPQQPTPIEPPDVLVPNPSTGNSMLDSLPVNAIGVDISHHNKTVNLSALAKSVSFIYMKATEGASFVSSVYLSRAKELKALGVAWGAYHYYKINVDPLVQAKHFVKFKDGWTMPPVLDIEAISNDGYNSRIHTLDLLIFLNYIEKHTGMIPVVYCGYYFARDHIKPTLDFAKYPLWIAWYTTDFSKVKVPLPWKKIKLWQFTETGKIDGVIGNVDINRVVS
jgi:lysozyme